MEVLPYCSDSVAWAQTSPNLQTLSQQYGNTPYMSCLMPHHDMYKFHCFRGRMYALMPTARCEVVPAICMGSTHVQWNMSYRQHLFVGHVSLEIIPSLLISLRGHTYGHISCSEAVVHRNLSISSWLLLYISYTNIAKPLPQASPGFTVLALEVIGLV